ELANEPIVPEYMLQAAQRLVGLPRGERALQPLRLRALHGRRVERRAHVVGRERGQQLRASTGRARVVGNPGQLRRVLERLPTHEDRKSTRLNSSHVKISYAV